MNNPVLDIIISPSGLVYATGTFTTAGGVAANRIAVWNGATWSALGAGLDSDGRALVFGLDGMLYVGGSFTTAGGAPASKVAKWDGAAWSALGAGMTGGVNPTVRALAIGMDGTLYAGGSDFTTAGVVAVANIAKWDGAAWSALGAGTSGEVDVIETYNNLVYAGGTFVTAGGITVNQIAVWNGTSWAGLNGGGDGGDVLSMSVAQDGTLYVGGGFTSMGGLSLTDRVARWNGSTFSHLDIDFPGAASVYGLLASRYTDPINGAYDLYLCFSTNGTGTFAGKVTATNEGSTEVYPKIVFTRSGGTSAIIETLRNETTGQEIFFDYSLLDGESLTIDLAPTKKSIVSSFFGPRMDAVLANSDFGEWALQPGDSAITSFVATAGAPTVTAYMLWKEKFASYD